MMKMPIYSTLLYFALCVLFFSCNNNLNSTKDEALLKKISFETKVFKKEIKAFSDKKNSPKKIYIYEVATPKSDDREYQWLIKEIKDILKIPIDSNVESGIEDLIAKDSKEYIEIAKDLFTGNDEYLEMMNHERNVFLKPSFNANGYLTLSFNVSAYEGGAHGSYAFIMYNYDVINIKKLTLSEVINVDTVVLQQLLEKELRKEFSLSPNESLTSVLFEENIKLNNNFYLTNEGLGFMYNTYEIAPYATGAISLLIPYSELKSLLVQSFAVRMGLVGEES